jgi:two-component system sensor histidine kinase/response regulator
LTDSWEEIVRNFRTAFRAAPVGMALISADPGSFGRFLDVNPALCRITGYSAEQLRSVDFQALTHPDDLPAGLALGERVRSGELPGFEIEKRYIHADGHPVWVRLFASLLSEPDPPAPCFLTHVLELTDIKRMQEALHQREQQLVAAQSLARLGSWEWDLTTNEISWSDELYRIFGLQPQEFVATMDAILAYVHPNDRRRVTESLEQAFHAAGTYEIKLDIVRPDGCVRACHALGRPVRDEHGHVVKLHGTAQDVTDATRTEAALREAHARLRLLHLIATTANDTSGWEEVLRIAVDEICAHTGAPIGRAYLSPGASGGSLVSSGIWHVDDAGRFAGFRRVIEGPSVASGHDLPAQVLSSGRPSWFAELPADPSSPFTKAAADAGIVAGFAFPILAGQQVSAVLEFFFTRLTLPEEDLLDLLAQVGTLLGRVADRHRAQDELAKARDEALQASRSKSEFLAIMSHEIRTPMNGVIGLTGLLLETGLTPAQREHAEGVRASGEALLGIINDILDFSKIEAGKLELECVDFDLAEAMEEVGALVAESARAKRLELVVHCHNDVPTALRGDVGRLRQILLNFATNAVKFTQSGEVVLRARRVADASSSDVMVHFEVVDTGIGVDPTTADGLFDPFSQADASTTRRYGGTGLGLAICRRLAEAMGGTIGVAAGPDAGSTFWVRLPFQPALDSVGDLAAAASGRLLEGRRALVVDDNETNCVVLTSQLRAWGMAVDPACGAEEGLRLLRRAAAESRPYELALVDMVMPGMNGMELARTVRADPLLSTVRLLLLSSVGVEPDARIEAGFVAGLTKPVRLSHLYDALVRAVTPFAIARPRPVASSPAVPPGSRGTLLVVEDHRINQEVAKGMVARLGYSCDVAADGIEALEALERRNYDAVLMDCQMPRMDGFQATAEIRRREAGGRHIPIFALTASALFEDRGKCIDAGMDDYLAKPVKSRDLEDMLNRWLVGSQPSSEATRTAPAADGQEADDVLDLEQFYGLQEMAAASDDPAFLGGLVERYLDTAGSRLGQMRDAARRKDAAALEAAAHGLKGTSAMMGAAALASVCWDLELAAIQGDVLGRESLDRVSAELERAAMALRLRVASSGRSLGEQ